LLVRANLSLWSKGAYSSVVLLFLGRTGKRR
jgi:hypothetical protein